MAIEVKEMVIKTTVESGKSTGDSQQISLDLQKIKAEIIKESMDNVIEYLNRQKER